GIPLCVSSLSEIERARLNSDPYGGIRTRGENPCAVTGSYCHPHGARIRLQQAICFILVPVCLHHRQWNIGLNEFPKKENLRMAFLALATGVIQEIEPASSAVSLENSDLCRRRKPKPTREHAP